MKGKPGLSGVLTGLTGMVLGAGLGPLAACSAQPSGHHSSASTTQSASNSGSAERIGSETGDAARNGLASEIELVPPSVARLLETRATLLGPHPGTAPIRLTVGMKLRNAAALKRFDDAVADPASPDYRHYLTPAEFAARYGPSREDVTAVTNWLKAQGIRVLDVLGTLIHTEAPTQVYEQAFHIRINDYRMNSRTFYSTTDRATLPQAIAAKITGILGLNNGVRLRPLSQRETLISPAQSRLRNAPSPATPSHAADSQPSRPSRERGN